MSLHKFYEVVGCDVSSYQTSIDFDKLLDRGIWFIIARASIGVYPDSKYQQHKAGAIQYGLPFGAYHAWIPTTSAANNAATMVKAQPTRPPVGAWLDIEAHADNLTWLQTSEHIYQTLEYLDKTYGLTGIYTNQEAWQRLIHPSYYDKLRLAERPLWVANYFTDFVLNPHLPLSWPSFDFWQFSAETGPYAAQAIEFGVSGAKSLDIDVFNGSVEEFQEFVGGVIEPPEPPGEPPMQIKTKVVCNIRNNPDLTAGSDVGNLEAGKVLNVIAEIAEFYKVETYVAKSVVEPVIIPPPPIVPEYYVAHDFLTIKLPNGRVMPAKGVVRSVAPNPEVFWLSEKMVQLTAPLQKLINEMNQPYMSEKSFTQNLASNVAWANGTGFNEIGDPRNNYITGVMGNKDPFLDKCRICGGAIIRGTENNGILTVDVIDATKPLPKWDDLKLKPWLYFRAWIVNVDGSVFDFPYCGGQPLYMPLIGIPPVTVKLNFNDTDRPAIPYIVRI